MEKPPSAHWFSRRSQNRDPPSCISAGSILRMNLYHLPPWAGIRRSFLSHPTVLCSHVSLPCSESEDQDHRNILYSAALIIWEWSGASRIRLCSDTENSLPLPWGDLLCLPSSLLTHFLPETRHPSPSRKKFGLGKCIKNDWLGWMTGDNTGADVWQNCNDTTDSISTRAASSPQMQQIIRQGQEAFAELITTWKTISH